MEKYYGKYRAIVVDIEDPDERGRIRVQCPKVLHEAKSAWCEPCIPFAYEAGGDFYLPKMGDTVWIEFEGGNVNTPIWVGNWWTKENTPKKPEYGAKYRVIEFDGTHFLMSEEGLVLEAGGCRIEVIDEETINVTANKKLNIVAGGCTLILEDKVTTLVASEAFNVTAGGCTLTLSGGTITAQGKVVNVTGDEAVNISSGGEVTLSGSKINLN